MQVLPCSVKIEKSLKVGNVTCLNNIFGRQLLRPFHLLLCLRALLRLRRGLGSGADRHPADMLFGTAQDFKV